jgi:hypothetical protein
MTDYGFRLEQPGFLLEIDVDGVQQVSSRRIRGLDPVVDGTKGVHDRTDAVAHHLHRFSGAVLIGRRWGNSGRRDDFVCAPVGDGVNGAHTFGDGVAGFVGAVDNAVELQVQIAEVCSDNIPVSLLTLQLQLDRVDEYLLQALRQALRGVECVHLICVPAVGPD